MFALFEDFCRAHKLDPIVLLRQAYPDESYTEQNLHEIRRAADWERTAYQPLWDRTAIDGLLESLHAVNYHELATVVGDIADGLS